MGSKKIQYFFIILNVTINILYHLYIHNGTTLSQVNSSQSAARTIYITYLDSSWISAFHRWRVKAGEERPVTHRVALREDKRLGIAIRQLWIQPPDLSKHDAKKRWAKGIKITRVNCQKNKSRNQEGCEGGAVWLPRCTPATGHVSISNNTSFYSCLFAMTAQSNFSLSEHRVVPHGTASSSHSLFLLCRFARLVTSPWQTSTEPPSQREHSEYLHGFNWTSTGVVGVR